MSRGLAAVLQRHVKNPAVQQHPPAELEQRLRELLDACHAAWPALDVPAEVFTRHLAEHLPDEGDLAACLARMQCADLYLACGCVEHVPAALAAFERGVLSQVAPVLQRMGLPAAQIDEVIQVVRAKLLVADEPGQRPLLASYAGRGVLVGWVRTTARRAALSLRRNKDEQVGGNEAARREAERIPLPPDAEIEFIKRRYQDAFKQAVEDALGKLAPEQLSVLRMSYMEGLSIDRIAAILSVHRATAARRIVAAADAVGAEARRLLHERLGLGGRELESLAGMVQSQLHLSLSRLLRGGDDGGDGAAEGPAPAASGLGEDD